MIEERIKELAAEWYKTKNRNDWRGMDTKITDLVRTVAAESRKEGIDAMRDKAKKVAIAYCPIVDIEVDIDAEAERLKEQG